MKKSTTKLQQTAKKIIPNKLLLAQKPKWKTSLFLNKMAVSAKLQQLKTSATKEPTATNQPKTSAHHQFISTLKEEKEWKKSHFRLRKCQ